MERLLTDLIRIQLAMIDGWINAMTHMWRGCQHLLGTNVELLRHPAFHRWHDIHPLGPDWMDHYGKRSHDVDVEHMR
jgi:hypothetical protein